MKSHKKNGKTPLERPLKKAKAPKKTRAQRKAEKKAVLPLHKRPVICPPDRAGRHFLFRWGGLICRALVIWLAASGLVIFMSNALGFGVMDPIVLAVSLVAVTLSALFCLGKTCKLISAGITGVTAAVLFATNIYLPLDLFHGVLSMYNAALDRLYAVGYVAYVRFKVPVPSALPTPQLLMIGVCLLTVLVSVLFTLFLFRRTRLIPPAVLATGVLVVILTFNIYSNSIVSNLGIVLIIVSFAAVLIMAAYDRLYRGKVSDAYDNELRLFEDGNRPALPPGYMTPKEVRQARREERRARKLAKAQKKKKGKATVPAAETAAAEPTIPRKPFKHTKETKKQVKAFRKYEWISEQSRIAMGGYAAAAMLLVCSVVIALPAAMVRDNFNTIDAIDEKMELARNYVTALLRGDDKELDRYEYMANSDNFTPHSTELTHPQYDGTQILYVTTRYDNTNYYLRGWIGTKYEDGAWLTANETAVNYYYSLFGKDSSPSEDLKYSFFHYMNSELVDDPAYTENIFTRYRLNREYGFVNVLVNVKRINSPSTLTYFPTTFDPRYGVFEGYGQDVESPVSFVNYYDGLYTGRKYHESGLSYSTYTYAPIMTDPDWIRNVAELEAAFSLQKEILLAQTGFYTDTNGKVTSYLKLDRPKLDKETGSYVFTYTYKRDTTTKAWQFYHDSFKEENGDYVVTTPVGTMTLDMNGRYVVGVTYTPAEKADGQTIPDLIEAYNYKMTVEDGKALMEYLETDTAYSSFVYTTYTGKSGSQRIKDLALTIRDQVHRDELYEYEEIIPDDPETEDEDESDTVIHKEYRKVSVPLEEVRLASLRNTADPTAFEMRDLLVRNVIDYVIDEMGCTYTLEPNLDAVDPALDGVENFLFNTKEGYCVQFASAAALILRELNIPVRYVEGYVADDFKKIDRKDFVYGSIVIDRQEHAWIEVYFDGVGWIQYETTPPYYSGLYGNSSNVGATPAPPAYPDDSTKPPVSDDPWPDVGGDVTEETEEETTEDGELVDEEVAKAGFVMLVILAIMGVGIAGISSIVSRARAAEEHRRGLASQVLEDGFGRNTTERDRREIALELTDAVMGLLSYFELSPKAGEFKDDYANRLTAELTRAAKGKKANKERNLPDLPDIRTVMSGIAAEEFGHGMSVEEMRELALLYLYLRLEIRRRIPFSKRLKLRYIQRKI